MRLRRGQRSPGIGVSSWECVLVRGITSQKHDSSTRECRLLAVERPPRTIAADWCGKQSPKLTSGETPAFGRRPPIQPWPVWRARHRIDAVPDNPLRKRDSSPARFLRNERWPGRSKRPSMPDRPHRADVAKIRHEVHGDSRDSRVAIGAEASDPCSVKRAIHRLPTGVSPDSTIVESAWGEARKRSGARAASGSPAVLVIAPANENPG
jgi:hypothetical protein